MNVIPYKDGNYTVNGVYTPRASLTQLQIDDLDDIVREQNRSRKPKSKRRSTTRRSSGGRNWSAAQVLQRKQNLAMAELVERVNDDDEITD